MHSHSNNIPFLKSISGIIFALLLVSISPLQAKEKEIVDIVFLGGQSNAVGSWANGIKKELEASKAFSKLVVVHKYHPGHWLQNWYTDKPNKNFNTDFYNNDGTGALEKAWKQVIATGKTPRLAGFFWFQGEGDTGDPNIATNYEQRFNKIMALLQSHFKQSKPIPFAVAIIDANQEARYNDPKVLVGRTREKVEKMRSIHKKLGQQSNGVAVDTREFPRRDAWHLSGKSAEEVGNKMAKSFLKKFKGDDQVYAHEPSSIKVADKKAVQSNSSYDISAFSPEQQKWELLLKSQLGSFYYPLYIKAKKAGRETAWDYVKDQPGLPRILVIGDSISRGCTLPLRRALKGKVNVHRAPMNCGPTAVGLKYLDSWLGDGKWDLITFNFGIHDRNTPSDKYSKRLAEITKRLKATGAKLVWVTTTPVPEGAHEYVKGSTERLNKVANQLMKQEGISILDFNTAITPLLGKYQLPKNCHYRNEGYEFLAALMAEMIQKQVKK